MRMTWRGAYWARRELAVAARAGEVPVSPETASRALTRAPVPADRGGRPATAHKFVLAGLPNHAGPPGVTRPGGMA